MSKARSNLFVFTEKRLMKKTVGNLTDHSHSAASFDRLSQAFAGLISAGLVLWFLVVAGVSGWSYLCVLALLICSLGVDAISTSAGHGSLVPGHQPRLMSIKLGSVSRERDLAIDAFIYYDPEFTRDIDFQIPDYSN